MCILLLMVLPILAFVALIAGTLASGVLAIIIGVHQRKLGNSEDIDQEALRQKVSQQTALFFVLLLFLFLGYLILRYLVT